MLLHLQQAADARTVSIKASLVMNMGNHFRQITDQLGERAFLLCELSTGQNRLPGVAGISVRVGRFFIQAADRNIGHLVTCVTVGMTIGLLLAAGKLPGDHIASFVMNMAGLALQGTNKYRGLHITIRGVMVRRNLLQRADQGLLRGEAGIRVGMRLPFGRGTDQCPFLRRVTGRIVAVRRGIAAFIMSVGFDLRQAANQNTAIVIAALIVGVQHKIGITTNRPARIIIASLSMGMKPHMLGRTDKNSLRDRFLLLITFLGMNMFFNTANGLSIHCNCGKDQRICCTEHHNGRQNHNSCFPDSILSVVLLIMRCVVGSGLPHLAEASLRKKYMILIFELSKTQIKSQYVLRCTSERT